MRCQIDHAYVYVCFHLYMFTSCPDTCWFSPFPESTIFLFWFGCLCDARATLNLSSAARILLLAAEFFYKSIDMKTITGRTSAPLIQRSANESNLFLSFS